MDQIEQAAREGLGFRSLRPGQREAVEAALEGRDTLVVMSTGSGKSAVYQLAGLLIPGATLVISPLISLQRDQVDAISERLPGEAANLDASVAERKRDERLEDLARDELEFLFLAPEQLARPETVEALREAGPSLLVVDEAHCISEWGHDFRPDYMRIGALVEELGHPTVIALTATASPPVREEIVERLGMDDPAVIVRGFDRPNIRLAVERHREQHDKRAALVDRAADLGGPGIVYAATRRAAEELAELLAARGMRAAAYHAGQPRRERDRVQERFMDDELDVIAATTAFGMGVDKPNVRFVLHHDPSDSIDSLYQEVGRAGRDDEPAEAVLFYRPEDLGRRRFFAAGGQVDGDELEQVAVAVRDHRGPAEPAELRERTELSESKLAGALNRLEDAGAVELLPDGKVEAAGLDEDELEGAVQRATAAEQDRHHFDRSRVEMMSSYAEHDGCRRHFILSYFGEAYDPPCDNCDNCEAGRVEAEIADQPFPVGARVAHGEWGDGVVQRYGDDRMSVLFDSVGYKTLSVELVLERGLLTAPEG